MNDKSTFSTGGNRVLQRIDTGTCERLVAFLDIMGFKDMVARQNETKIESKLFELSEYITQSVNKEQNFIHFIFSDSIILFGTNDNLENIFDSFVSLVGKIVEKSISLGLPIQGALSKGSCTVAIGAKPFYFGQPIIDAYLLEESVVMYGVVLHNSVEEYAERLSNNSELVYDYDVVLKGGHSKHYIVNWARNDFELNRRNVLNIRKTVSDSPRRYVDNTMNCMKYIYD